MIEQPGRKIPIISKITQEDLSNNHIIVPNLVEQVLQSGELQRNSSNTQQANSITNSHEVTASPSVLDPVVVALNAALLARLRPKEVLDEIESLKNKNFPVYKQHIKGLSDCNGDFRELGLELQRIAPDGYCIYGALASLFQVPQGELKLVLLIHQDMVLRCIVAELARDYASYVHAAENFEDGEDWLAFCDRLTRPSESKRNWGCEACLLAWTNLTQRSFLMFSPDVKSVYVYPPSDEIVYPLLATPDVQICGMVIHGEHYDVVVPKQALQNQQPLSDELHLDDDELQSSQDWTNPSLDVILVVALTVV